MESSQSGEIVDDNDLSKIRYLGNWEIIGFDGFVGDTDESPSIMQGNTVHQTHDLEAVATFSFTGTSVSVHGLVVRGCTPPMEFTLDHGEPLSTKENLTFSDNCFDGVSSKYIWFSKEDIMSGNHVLTIQMNQAVSQDNEYFILDYMQYMPSEILKQAATSFLTTASSTSDESSATVDQTSKVSSHITQSTTSQHQTDITNSQTGVSESSSSRLLPSQSAKQQSFHASRSLPIVGAVLGTLALVLVVLFFWCKRRTRPNTSNPEIKSVESASYIRRFFTGNRTVQPFELMQSSMQSQSVKQTPGISTSTSAALEQGDVAATSETPSNLRLAEVVTRLERIFSEIQTHYAQMEGHSAAVSGADLDDQTHTQFTSPPPYDAQGTHQGAPLQQGDSGQSPDDHLVQVSFLHNVRQSQQYPDTSQYANRLSGTSAKLHSGNDTEGLSPSHGAIN